MNESQQLEHYLQSRLTAEDRLLMDARLIIDKGLQDKLQWQKKTYALIQAYGRKKLREEIEQLQERMFTEKRFQFFQLKIKNIFK